MSQTFRMQDATGNIVIDQNGYILMSAGTGAPTNSVAGYTKGSMYFRTDGSAGTLEYLNVGTTASTTWIAQLNNDSNANIGALKATSLAIGVSGSEVTIAATPLELNRSSQLSSRIVTVTADLTVTAALHDGRTVVINNSGASSATMTLPTASGSGARFKFFVGTTLSGGGTIIITDTAAHLYGSVTIISDSAFQAGTLFTVGGISAGTGSTSFTMDGSTKGGKKGDVIEVEDMATNVYEVRAILSASGTEATMFS